MVANNISKYLRQNEDDFEMNHELIRIKDLFQGFTIKVQVGSNFSEDKYTDCNRIILKYCMLYYLLFWNYRNIKLHNSRLQ